MQNIQQFTDTDGHHVEIDRRTVQDAYVERRDGGSTIQITWGEGKTCSLGIGARQEIEGWLGRELKVLSPVAAEYKKPVASIIIGGKDYSDTDPEARAIMDHLAGQGVTEQVVARTPYRILLNMILKAHLEIIEQALAAEAADRAAPSNDNAISAYLHCGRCVGEFQAGQAPDGESMATWARLTFGWTPIGIQVWCERHQCNVLHIDFEGERHPANTTARSDG